MTKTVEERFWAKVDKTGSCWEWTASRDSHGYGQLAPPARGMRPLKAHRVSWAIHSNSPIGEMHVLHRCDNPPCVRPDHLFLGTPQDNATDRVNKGRDDPHHLKARPGELNGCAKLTWENVRELRARHHEAPVVYTTEAKRLKVDPALIRRIILGTSWKEA